MSISRLDRCGWGLVAVLMLLLSGCEMHLHENVLWLPDSSGIVYPEQGGHRISRYDFATGKTQVLIPETGVNCSHPALNSDGTLLALSSSQVRSEKNSKERSIRDQIHFFDLQGLKVHSSTVIESKVTLKEVGKKSETLPVELPLHFIGSEDLVIAERKIYSLRDSIWTIVAGNVFPLFVMPYPQTIGLNDRGFLAACSEPDRIVFIEWDGKVSEFENQLPGEMTLVSFAWDGQVARFGSSEGEHLYDTDNMTCSLRKEVPNPVITEGDRLHWLYTFPGTSLILEILVDPGQESTAIQTLVLFDQSTGRKNPVKLGGDFHEMRIFPSPDNDKVAVRCALTKNPQQELIVIIDESGKVLDKIPCQASAEKAKWMFFGEEGEPVSTELLPAEVAP